MKSPPTPHIVFLAICAVALFDPAVAVALLATSAVAYILSKNGSV